MKKMGEVNSDEWNKIKGWVGGANGKKDHPLVQEAKRAQRVQKFDEGSGDVEPIDPAGIPGPEPYMDPNTLKNLPLNAPMPSAPALRPPIQPLLQAPPIAPAAPSSMPDSGSQVNKILGTSPDELKSFLQRVNQPNWRQQVGSGVTGLADALSRAGGSNSDYEKQYNEKVQQGKEGMSAIPGKVADLGKEKFGLTQTLDAQNPTSQYSKINQATYGPDLLKMGLTQAEVSKMPASLIGDLLGKKITLDEAKARIAETGAYQQGMLQNTRLGLEQGGRHQQAEDEAQRTARQTEKDKAIAGGSSLPFVGPSHTEKQAAFHRLAGDQGGSQPTSTGPYGQTTVKNGVEYEWSPISGKYHPK